MQSFQDLQRINASLTLALVEYQNHTAKQGRQIECANQDIANLKSHVSSLENVLLQQSQQHQAELEKLRSQHQIEVDRLQRSMMAPPAAGLPSLLLQNSMAGTLISSPSKSIRRPLFDLERENKPQPLKLSALPKRQQPSKRAPMNSPPAKQAQSKRVDNRPTPQKISLSVTANDDDKDESIMSLDAIQKADWRVSKEAPSHAPSELLLTAIYRQSNGSVAILKSSLDCLVGSVPACRSIRQQREPTTSEAAKPISKVGSLTTLDRKRKEVAHCPPKESMHYKQSVVLSCSTKRRMYVKLSEFCQALVGGRD